LNLVNNHHIPNSNWQKFWILVIEIYLDIDA